MMQLPFEILVQGRPASVNDSSKKKAWKDNVELEAILEVLKGPVDTWDRVATGEIMAKIFWFPPGKSYADVDNGVKWTIDALDKIVFENDKQIQRIVAHRLKDTSGSRLIVEGSSAGILLDAIKHQTGKVTGVREFATAIKIEAYSPTGGVWW